MFNFPNTNKPDFSKIEKLDYDSYWRRRGFALNKKLKEREELILSLLVRGDRVLDIGCGNSLLPIEAKAKGVEIEVADISEVVLASFAKYDIAGRKIDLEKIREFSLLGKYNMIILSEVLEHLKNPEEVIFELKKITDCFILTIPNSAFYRYRWHLLVRGRFFKQWVHHPSEHLRFWSHVDFLDWLKAVGLETVRVLPSNGFSFFGLMPWLKNFWPNLLAHQIVYCCKNLPQ